MRKVSVLVPTYNEQDNVEPLTRAIIREFEASLPEYDYEIVFIDNHSMDRTRDILKRLCKENKKIKAIFNTKNFGQFNSPFYGILQTTGDCTILMCADFQDPIELIPAFIKEWENGYKIVIGKKVSSCENRMIYFLRTCYYKLIKKFSDIEQIEHFTGFGLYDRDFVEVLRKLDDPTPFLRGIVAELGYDRKEIPYEQRKRRSGKTSNNFFRLYDAAMLSFTSYTKIGLRISMFIGFFIAAVSIVIAMIYFVLKIVYWNTFVAGTAPILIGMFFLGAVQLIFLGVLGEYILSINQRVMKRPLVIEEERLNFEHNRKESEEKFLQTELEKKQRE